MRSPADAVRPTKLTSMNQPAASTAAEPSSDFPTDPWERITVVMCTHNSAHILPTALGSLKKARRIIISDALSQDGTPEVAERAHPAVEVIRLTEDGGWGKSVNQGFARVETEYVFNINPDVRIPDGCVEQLVRTADANPNAAIVAPVLTNARGGPDIPYMGPWEHNHHQLKEIPEGPICTWFVNGAVVIWRTSAFKVVGGFDENIFLYNEDVDIAIRTTRAGFALILDPAARADHYGGESEEISLKSKVRRDKNMMWGHLVFERKYGGVDHARAEARRQVRKCLGDAALGVLKLRPGKVVTNLVKARAARGFLAGEAPWGRG